MTNLQLEGASRATARYVHISPYKIRQVLALIRGLPVQDAERILELSEKDAGDYVAKVLNSAIANAASKSALEAEELFVARAWADEGPTRKWGQPRARGRYFRIRKRTSHITIVLERFEMDQIEERRRRDESTGRSGPSQRSRAERVRRSRQTRQEETASDETEAETDEVEDETAATEAETVETPEASAGTDDDAADEEPEGEEE
jgi:large subunit ribosomal protein L22